MGEDLGKFHNSSDYDLNTLRSYYLYVHNYRETCQRKHSNHSLNNTYERERKLGVRKRSEMFSFGKTPISVIHRNKVCVFKHSIQMKLRYTSC